LKAVKKLIEAKADWTIEGSRGTPYDVAKASHNPEVAALYEELLGDALHAVNKAAGSTPLAVNPIVMPSVPATTPIAPTTPPAYATAAASSGTGTYGFYNMQAVPTGASYASWAPTTEPAPVDGSTPSANLPSYAMFKPSTSTGNFTHSGSYSYSPAGTPTGTGGPPRKAVPPTPTEFPSTRELPAYASTTAAATPVAAVMPSVPTHTPTPAPAVTPVASTTPQQSPAGTPSQSHRKTDSSRGNRPGQDSRRGTRGKNAPKPPPTPTPTVPTERKIPKNLEHYVSQGGPSSSLSDRAGRIGTWRVYWKRCLWSGLQRV
jgi:hypothetical protein